MLAEFGQRFFPNRAVTLCLEALQSCDNLFAEEIIWPSVFEAIKPTMFIRSDKRDKVVKDENAAARLILSIVADYSERQLSYGNYHIYRGMLSQTGQSLRNISEEALRRLEDSGWMDHDEWQDRIDRLDNLIASAG